MIKGFLLVFLMFALTLIAEASNGLNIKNENIMTTKMIESAYKKVGTAKFSVLFWDIYQSTLYTPSGSYSSESQPETLVFKITYLKDISAENLLERTIEQWQHLKVPEKSYEAFIPVLEKLWPNIRAGDTLTLHLKDEQSLFYYNDEYIGLVDEKEFGQLFLSIWLSPNTSQRNLRAELIGNTKNEE